MHSKGETTNILNIRRGQREPFNFVNFNDPPLQMYMEKKQKKSTRLAATTTLPPPPLFQQEWQLVSNKLNLRAGISVSALVTYIQDENCFFITDENYLYEVLQKIKNLDVDSLEEVGEPSRLRCGEICFARYSDFWSRAEILSLTPSYPIKVNYIDFGSTETLSSMERLKICPPEYTDTVLPSAAIAVTLLHGNVHQYNILVHNSVTITPIKKDYERNSWHVLIGDKSVTLLEGKLISQTGNCAKKTKHQQSGPHTKVLHTPAAAEAEEVIGTTSRVENTKMRTVPEKSETNNVDDQTECSFLRTKKNHLKEVDSETRSNLLVRDGSRAAISRLISVGISFTKPVPIIESLHVGEEFSFVPFNRLSKCGAYSGMLIPSRSRYSQELDTLNKCAKILNPTFSYRAQRNDLVAVYVHTLNEYCRGYVWNTPNSINSYYQLLLIDKGVPYRSSTVLQLEDQYKNIPSLAVKCELKLPPPPSSSSSSPPLPLQQHVHLKIPPWKFSASSSQHKPAPVHDFQTFLERSYYHLQDKVNAQRVFKGFVLSTSTSKNDGATLVSNLYMAEEEGKEKRTTYVAELSTWTPTVEDVGLESIQIENGDRVKITAFNTATNTCYVCPVSNDRVQDERNCFLEKVAIHCKRKGKLINGKLGKKAIVGVPYLNSFWRAQIKEEIKDGYMAQILDVGTNVKLSPGEARSLPASIKYHNRYAVKIYLKNVPITDVTKKADDYLKFVVANESEFTLKIEEDSALVELLIDTSSGGEFADKLIFNDHLRKLLEPAWTELLENNQDFGSPIYYLSKMKFDEWQLGSTISLHVTEYYDENTIVAVTVNGEAYKKHVKTNLWQRINEYAESINEPYVPTKDEMCLAKFENNWYRAVCINPQPGQDLPLQLIDIGYLLIVPNTSIRKIPYEFLISPATACLCNVLNYGENKNVANLKGKLLPQCRVVKKVANGEYDIQIQEDPIHLFD